jgi:hypothetical protein
MNQNDDDYYERQTELLEKFLLKNDKTAFMKMLNMNINPNLDKEKENNHKKNIEYMKSMKIRTPVQYYDYFHIKQQTYNNNLNNNNDFFNYNNNYKDNQINNFKLDFHNILQDPEYKDKCMKGNYKWGNMKFQMMKLNLAKRRGVSIDNLHMAKISDRRKNNMEMNGQFVINNNPLAHSINYGRKNTVNGLDNNIRSKMGKIKQENLIKRQYTHKVKHNAHKNEINKLDINF